MKRLDPVSRLVDICLAALLAAMALYGAVLLLREIWIYLCLIAAVISIVGGLVWLVNTRYRGW